MTISLAELREKLKPDVMGWINQAIANTVLTGVTVNSNVDGQDIKPNTVTTTQLTVDVGTSTNVRAIVAGGEFDGQSQSQWVMWNRGTSVNTATGLLMAVKPSFLFIGGILAKLIDATAGAEYADLIMRAMVNGTLTDIAAFYGTGLKIGFNDGTVAPDSALELDAGDDSIITLPEISAAPSNPASNKIALYVRDDGAGTTKAYTKNSAGQEVELGGSGVTLPSLSGTSAHFMAPWGYGHADSTNPETGVNQVRCCRFLIPIEITVASLHFEVTTGDSGKVVNLGIYSADGNTLLCNTGAVSITSTGAKSVTLGSPVTLPAGMYWLAWTGNSSALRMRGVAADATAFINAGTAQIGTAANSSSVGVFPSTLGAITGATHAVPKLKLQGA